MEWVKVLEFEFPGKDHNDLPIMHTVTCKWRSDGVCYFLNSKRYPNNEGLTAAWKSQSDWRWSRFIEEETDVKQASEDEFDRSFLMNMISQFGTMVDTGFAINPRIEQEVLSEPKIIELYRLGAKYGQIYGE